MPQEPLLPPEDIELSTKTLDMTEEPGQKNSSVFSYSGLAIPAVLISYGIIAQGSNSLKKLDQSVHNKISKHIKTKVPIDDYMQYAPAIAVYGLELTGLKAKHNVRDRTIVMATSYLMVAAVTQTTKRLANVPRPDGSNNKSFPSGHTATAFAGAHLLCREYSEASPYIALTGYVIASGTGALRAVNKRHWISDVVAGAGVGILCVETGYRLLPVMQSILGANNQNKRLEVKPIVHSGAYGLGLAYTF